MLPICSPVVTLCSPTESEGVVSSCPIEACSFHIGSDCGTGGALSPHSEMRNILEIHFASKVVKGANGVKW